MTTATKNSTIEIHLVYMDPFRSLCIQFFWFTRPFISHTIPFSSLSISFLLVCVQPVFIDAHSSMVTLWLSRTTFSLLSSLARSNSIERHSRAKWRGYSLQFDGIDDGDNIVSESVAFLLSPCFALFGYNVVCNVSSVCVCLHFH